MVLGRQPTRDTHKANLCLASCTPVVWGVAKNDTEAAKWVRKAAVPGETPNAQAAIGLIYVNGLGVSQDYSEAARWYRRAADTR